MVSPGLGVVFVYFAFTYVLPWLLNTSYDLQSLSTYRIHPIHGAAIAFTALIALALIALDRKRSPINSMAHGAAFFPGISRWRFAIALASLVAAFMAQQAGLSGFRYARESAFVEASPLVYAIACLPFILKFDFFCQVFFGLGRGKQASSLNTVTRFLIFGAFLLSISGTGAVLTAFVYLLYAVFPNHFVALVTQSRSGRPALVKGLIAAGMVGLIVVPAWLLGETVKRSGDSDSVLAQALDPSFTNWAIFWFIERISSSYYSFLFALDTYFFSIDIQQQFSNLVIPFQSVLYRIDVLLGRPFDVVKPATGALSRLNYELLALVVTEREGTTPGLFASFLLSFPYPLNAVVLIAYTVWLSRFFTGLIRRMTATPNFIGLGLIAWLTLVFFESPIDFFVLFDEANLMLFMFVGFYLRILAVERKTRSRAARHRINEPAKPIEPGPGHPAGQHP